MNKFLKQVSITVATMAALTATSLAAEGTVTASSSLRLREESNTSSSILTTLPYQSVVDVLAVTENGWYQVNYGGKTGFVSGDYLAVDDVASLPLIKDPVYGVVSAGPLNVRSEATTESAVQTILGVGSVMIITDDSIEGWYGTESGYVSAQYVDMITAEEAASLKAAANRSTGGDAVAEYALTLKGCRYVYGGTTTSGFDCSGFVQYVYKQMGYSINRTSSSQYSNGVSVSKANLQPGDIVFFSKSGNGITHVGIYIGNNEFIHASSPSTGVIISSLSSSYYTSGYVGARRIV